MDKKSAVNVEGGKGAESSLVGPVALISSPETVTCIADRLSQQAVPRARETYQLWVRKDLYLCSSMGSDEKYSCSRGARDVLQGSIAPSPVRPCASYPGSRGLKTPRGTWRMSLLTTKAEQAPPVWPPFFPSMHLIDEDHDHRV